jgi:hypothetical protein
MASYEYKVGTSADSMVLLSTLGVPAPHHNFVPYSTERVLGDGSTKGLGWPEDEWYWGFLKQAQRDALRAYVPDRGAHIFVRTLVDDGLTWTDFECEAEWMKQEDRVAGRRMGFSLKLRAMVEVE